MAEITPETKLLFYSKSDEDLWSSRLARLRYAYEEAEFKTFYNDMRDIYIYHVNSMDFDRSYNFLREFDLIYYPTNKSALYSGFSHRHVPVVPGQPYTLYGAAVKRTKKKKGEEFVEANSKSDHGKIGQLLGYPDCCVDWFNQVWGKPSVDPIFESAVNTIGNKRIDDNTVVIKAHPYSNQMLRYFGIRITPQLNHSMRCEKSIEQGKKWFKIMSEIDNDAALWARELLSMPSKWDCYGGVAQVDTKLFRGITNSDLDYTRRVVINEGWSDTV